MAARLILADGVKKYDAPRSVVHELLLDPRGWLRLRAGEVLPVASDGTSIDHLVWSSLWPHVPGEIVFELSPWATPSDGTALRYRWIVGEAPEERTAEMVRYRLSRRESLPIT
jgi:hypothetical protein